MPSAPCRTQLSALRGEPTTAGIIVPDRVRTDPSARLCRISDRSWVTGRRGLLVRLETAFGTASLLPSGTRIPVGVVKHFGKVEALAAAGIKLVFASSPSLCTGAPPDRCGAVRWPSAFSIWPGDQATRARTTSSGATLTESARPKWPRRSAARRALFLTFHVSA